MATSENGALPPSVQPRAGIILTLARHLAELERRHDELDHRRTELGGASQRGEAGVYPELSIVEDAATITLAAIDACRQLILLSAPTSPAEAAVVLVCAVADLSLEVDSDPTEHTRARCHRIVDALGAVVAELQGSLPADLEALAPLYVMPSRVRAAAGKGRG